MTDHHHAPRWQRLVALIAARSGEIILADLIQAILERLW